MLLSLFIHLFIIIVIFFIIIVINSFQLRLQDAAKVYTYKFLIAFNLFQYNDTGMIPNHSVGPSPSSSSRTTMNTSNNISLKVDNNSARAKKGK